MLCLWKRKHPSLTVYLIGKRSISYNFLKRVTRYFLHYVIKTIFLVPSSTVTMLQCYLRKKKLVLVKLYLAIDRQAGALTSIRTILTRLAKQIWTLALFNTHLKLAQYLQKISRKISTLRGIFLNISLTK